MIMLILIQSMYFLVEKVKSKTYVKARRNANDVLCIAVHWLFSLLNQTHIDTIYDCRNHGTTVLKAAKCFKNGARP